MALTRNEIRKRLAAFAKEQQGSSNERSQAQTFWLRFYECFGIRAESATIYEQSVKNERRRARLSSIALSPANLLSNTRAKAKISTQHSVKPANIFCRSKKNNVRATSSPATLPAFVFMTCKRAAVIRTVGSNPTLLYSEANSLKTPHCLWLCRVFYCSGGIR